MKKLKRLQRKKNLSKKKRKTPAQKIRDYFRGNKWLRLKERQEKNLKQ